MLRHFIHISPVILKNALIYSDNIYFAKAALKIGTEEMERSLSMLGFHISIYSI